MEAVAGDVFVMVAFLDRIGGITDGGTVRLEDLPVRDTRDLWRGVPGLDPQAPVADPVSAARVAAMRCALWLFGPDAARRDWGRTIIGKWLDWLLEAGDDQAEAWMRRQALRDVCEWAMVTGFAGKDSDLLGYADDAYRASIPRR